MKVKEADRRSIIIMTSIIIWPWIRRRRYTHQSTQLWLFANFFLIRSTQFGLHLLFMCPSFVVRGLVHSGERRLIGFNFSKAQKANSIETRSSSTSSEASNKSHHLPPPLNMFWWETIPFSNEGREQITPTEFAGHTANCFIFSHISLCTSGDASLWEINAISPLACLIPPLSRLR